MDISNVSLLLDFFIIEDIKIDVITGGICHNAIRQPIIKRLLACRLNQRLRLKSSAYENNSINPFSVDKPSAFSQLTL